MGKQKVMCNVSLWVLKLTYAELLHGLYVYDWTIFIKCEILENKGRRENMVLQSTALWVLKSSRIQSLTQMYN